MDHESRQVLEMGYGGAERITMNMGPQHPSTHGVLRVVLKLDGETVTESDALALLVEAGFLAGPRRAVLRP